ncbi:uncharacterized protein [Nicotiana sylvestris]|uniref:uncharacterized protein n=1 Tax=Nicotiana sylvestris TaxID=4096 RepID=UPI00388C7F0D
MTVTCNETTQQTDMDSEKDDILDEIVKEVENFENRPKSNLDETEIINLGDAENIKETQISIHLSPTEKKEYTEFLKEYEDIFAWSYDDMTGLSTSIVAHKLPIDPMCPLVKQKLRKFKPDMSLKIKEEVTKHVKVKVLRVVEYPTWLANIVPVLKKGGKIWMDEEDAEKTTFTMQWGVYCYKMMPFGLKNAGTIYMRVMTTISHNMIYKEIEVYVDDVIIKSKKATDHVEDLSKFFNRLRRYNLKLNPIKCTFGVPAGKLLGFIIRRRGIEPDPSKVKAIQELPPPKNKKDVMSFLGRLNYISRFKAQSTVICEPIFKMFPCTNNMAEYEAYILRLKIAIDMNVQELLVIGDSDLLIHPHVPRIQNEFADALATLSSMIHHPDKNFIVTIPVKNQPAYCAHVEKEADEKPWFHDIKEYLAK